jgi:hypothetical protein
MIPAGNKKTCSVWFAEILVPGQLLSDYFQRESGQCLSPLIAHAHCDAAAITFSVSYRI